MTKIGESGIIGREEEVVEYETSFEDGTPITSYLASGYAEGFEEPSSIKDIIKAWSYLIGTGLVYRLQGWYGRNANAMIEQGVINEKGKVNWEIAEDKIK